MRLKTTILIAYLTIALRSLASECVNPNLNAALPEAEAGHLRVASYNVQFQREKPGQLINELQTPLDKKAKAVAEIIQRTRPHIVQLTNFDIDSSNLAIEQFKANYLEVSQNQQHAIEYPYVFAAPFNSRYSPINPALHNKQAHKSGVVLLSMYPIHAHQTRSFETFSWATMPSPLMNELPNPVSKKLPPALPLFEGGFWDVSVWVEGHSMRLLIAQLIGQPAVIEPAQTPSHSLSALNDYRHFDEIRFLADYVGIKANNYYIRDDNGLPGGIPGDEFIFMGTLNRDAQDTPMKFPDGTDYNSIDQLLEHPYLDAAIRPTSQGAVQSSEMLGQVNDLHKNPPQYDTAVLPAEGSGNLQLDYILPSKNTLQPICAGSFWPKPKDKTYPLLKASGTHHRLIWMDIARKDTTNVW